MCDLGKFTLLLWICFTEHTILWDYQGFPEVLGTEQVHSKNDLGLLHLLVPSDNMSPSQTFNPCHDSLTLIRGENLAK